MADWSILYTFIIFSQAVPLIINRIRPIQLASNPACKPIASSATDFHRTSAFTHTALKRFRVGARKPVAAGKLVQRPAVAPVHNTPRPCSGVVIVIMNSNTLLSLISASNVIGLTLACDRGSVWLRYAKRSCCDVLFFERREISGLVRANAAASASTTLPVAFESHPHSFREHYNVHNLGCGFSGGTTDSRSDVSTWSAHRSRLRISQACSYWPPASQPRLSWRISFLTSRTAAIVHLSRTFAL